MADADVAEMIVPDKLCKKYGLAAAWVHSDKIGIYAYDHRNEEVKDKKSSIDPTDVKVHVIKPEIILFTPPLRKLVNESNGVFLSIYKLKSNTSGDIRTELLKHSKQYRSIIRACVENLQEEVYKKTDDKCSDDKFSEENKMMLENFLTIFYNIECVWHLTEILYIDIVPGDVILPHLLEWVRFHFPSREMDALKILSHKAASAELVHNRYWEAVFGCALHGKLELVKNLLSLHSKADHPAFVVADTVLQTMPTYNVYGGYSVNEFMIRWKHWQMDLLSNIESKTFCIDSHLEMLMKLVVGDESTMRECFKYTEAWYEVLAAKLFFTAPCCKQVELSKYANDVAKEWHATKHLDHIILALMERNLHRVVREIRYMSDNGWFAAHLIDLLYNCGELNVIEKQHSKSAETVNLQLNESLILEYANILMSHHSLWQCGASYLIHCPVQGLARLEILLQSLPMGTEARVRKIIDIASDNKLHHVVTSICKIQGVKCISQGRLGNALSWALKAQDGTFTTYIADQFLRYYAENGELQCRDLLENLGSCMLASDRLTFLGRYCEFHQMYSTGEFKDASRVLISLIASNQTPKYFWPILLMDAIPLLESEDVILSSTDTYELLRCVEAYGDSPKFADKIDTFRLAAARNLSRALNLEGCQTEHDR